MLRFSMTYLLVCVLFAKRQTLRIIHDVTRGRSTCFVLY